MKSSNLLIKNLDCFSFVPKSKILALDANILYYINNLDNVIPIEDFGGSRDDFQLVKATLYLLMISKFDNLMNENSKNLRIKEIIQNKMKQVTI